jgi:hypothetical protein
VDQLPVSRGVAGAGRRDVLVGKAPMPRLDGHFTALPIRGRPGGQERQRGEGGGGKSTHDLVTAAY